MNRKAAGNVAAPVDEGFVSPGMIEIFGGRDGRFAGRFIAHSETRANAWSIPQMAFCARSSSNSRAVRCPAVRPIARSDDQSIYTPGESGLAFVSVQLGLPRNKKIMA
jgi:hypothetical protein